MTSRTPPIVPSVIQAGSASSALIRRRNPQMGVTAKRALNGSALDPGPWKLRVQFSINGGQAQGTIYWVDVFYFSKSDGVLTEMQAATAPTGVDASFPLVEFSMPYAPTDQGTLPAGEFAGGAAFWAGPNMQFVNDVGLFQGPSGDFWWADLPGPNGPGGLPAAFFTWVPSLVDTEANYGFPYTGGQYGVLNPGGDPAPDFDAPLVGVYLRASQAQMSPGPYPPPFIATPLPEPDGGLLTLYNKFVVKHYPLSDFSGKQGLFSTLDTKSYMSSFLNLDSIGGKLVPSDATCFSNAAFGAYADISQPVPPATGAIGMTRAGSGLHVVG